MTVIPAETLLGGPLEVNLPLKFEEFPPEAKQVIAQLRDDADKFQIDLESTVKERDQAREELDAARRQIAGLTSIIGDMQQHIHTLCKALGRVMQ